jgi:hypothetical protein
MDLQGLLQNLLNTLSGSFLNFLAALGILFGGWLLALIVAAVVRAGLRRTDLDERIAAGISGEDGRKIDLEKWIARIVFWVILIFAIVGFLQRLNLNAVARPLEGLLTEVTNFIPALLSALVLLILAWMIASFVRFLIQRLATSAKLDERLSQGADIEPGEVSVSQSLATAAYWLIFLLFLPAILGALNVEGLVTPVQDMVGQILLAVPNVFSAIIILLVGWFIARIIRQVVTNLLRAVGADRVGENIGLVGSQSLSNLAGTVVYALILISTLIAALGKLDIEAISGPATAMLNTVLEAIPAIFGAALILGVSYLVARLVAGLVTSLLRGVGADSIPARLGLMQEGEEPAGRTFSELVGYLVIVAVMLFAATEAASLLGFTLLADMVSNFTSFGGQILLALAIFAIGVWLANLARNVVISTAGEDATFTANLARLAVLIFVGAMALQQMGIAEEIVNLAFGILLGAIGVAAALAFGLGSREVAGREVENWVGKMKGKD